jgi:hypothetical protein
VYYCELLTKILQAGREKNLSKNLKIKTYKKGGVVQDIIKNKWQFEVIKNNGEGLKGYGWNIIIYKNGVKFTEWGAFDSLAVLESYARDIVLSEEFNIGRADLLE